jgi:single-stranded DNA-specific DHH superfamily exonuclease
VRGYDRGVVDAFVQEVAGIIADLESRQTRESVIQRALEEVGEQTAAILQRAHETADEIAARSRAQAEGRLQRAEREAELMREQADEYSEQVVVDTRLLWEERQRLVQDIRQLADDVLATAEDAAERLHLPQLFATQEEEPGVVAAEPPAAPGDVPLAEGDLAEAGAPPAEDDGPPTSEVEFDLLQGGAEDREPNGDGR